MGQVGIAFCHLGIAMTKNLLHLVEAPAVVDQERCKRMPQIMDAQLGHASFLAGRIP